MRFDDMTSPFCAVLWFCAFCGFMIGTSDELIAATALAHGLTLVTRNQRHFIATGCDVIAPWAA